MSELLNESVRKQVQEVFAGLSRPVQILFFGSQTNCELCEETRQLLGEVAALSPQLSVEAHDLDQEAELAARYRIDKAPAFVLLAREGGELVDTGVQYAGIPSGHEFTTLIQDLLLVSGGDSGLAPATREYLRSLDKPLHLQVFVTPSCPYCPRAVVLAHQMAMENPGLIRAEGVEATEFRELAERYHVSGVPQTTINAGVGRLVGAVPEANLLAEIQRVAAGAA